MRLKDLYCVEDFNLVTVSVVPEDVGYLVEESDERENGTYVAVNFSKESRKELSRSLKNMGIPNRHPSDKYHCTVMYSNNPLHEWEEENQEPIQFDPPKKFKVTEFEIFETRSDTNALVLRGECDYLNERYEMILNDHNADYSYDEYKPHVTVSYDCGNIDVEELDMSEVPEYLDIVEEYTEPVNTNYA
jgi:2'-5' RNA ligase